MRKFKYKKLDRKGYVVRQSKEETFKLLGVNPKNGYEQDIDTGFGRLWLIAPANWSKNHVKRIIQAEFVDDRCSHDYDCCGCYLESAWDVQQVGKRTFTFMHRYWRNI